MSSRWRLTCALLFLLGCGADDRPPEWAYISPAIMQPNCATVSCHSRAAAVAGLDFSDPERGYTSLTGLKTWVVDPNGKAGCRNVDGNTVCQLNFRPLLTPFNPEQSRLVNMLRARGADRMPPDRPLDEADIRLVERWIRDGAVYRRAAADAGANRGDASRGLTTTVVAGDGTMTIIAPDGSRTIIAPNGTTTMVGPDGKTTVTPGDGGAGDATGGKD